MSKGARKEWCLSNRFKIVIDCLLSLITQKNGQRNIGLVNALLTTVVLTGQQVTFFSAFLLQAGRCFKAFQKRSHCLHYKTTPVSSVNCQYFKNTKGNMNRICQILLRPSYASNLTATARTTMPLLVTAPRCWYSADAAAPPEALDKPTLDKLVRTNKVVVFMKGNPQAPRCGFSNAVVQIMRMHGVQYDAHDVLQNEALRQGMRTLLHNFSSHGVRI